MSISPSAVTLVESYLQRASLLPKGTRPPNPPLELSEFAIGDRMALATQLIRDLLADRFQGPAHFAASAAMFALLDTNERPSRESLEGLLHAIGATGSHLCGYPWEFAWKAAQKEIDAAGLTPSLYEALRAMQGSMKVHTSDKTAALHIDRVLWFETWSSLDPDRDAADIARRDLRAMSADDADAWQKLLLHGMNGQGYEQPRGGWNKKAAKLLQPIQGEFAALAASWFGSVGRLREIVLSKAGAEALRSVVWASVAAEQIPIDAVLAVSTRSWIRGREWSTRHERFVGSLAWAIELRRPPGGSAALQALHERFGRTTASEAIRRALAAQPP